MTFSAAKGNRASCRSNEKTDSYICTHVNIIYLVQVYLVQTVRCKCMHLLPGPAAL